MNRLLRQILLLSILLICYPSWAAPVTTVFNYQGRLDDNGQPAFGGYEFQVDLYDAETGGNLVDTVSIAPVSVTGGLFMLSLDFGRECQQLRHFGRCERHPSADRIAHRQCNSRQGDPENQFLSHSFVESPDMMNIYNGNVITDAEGYARVQMPDWFEALNQEFRYQLTVVRSFARATVWEKIADNEFMIRTDQPNVEDSWLVTGVRHDRWAQAHRIDVESLKSDAERGKYFHPELWGANPAKQLHGSGKERE